MTTQVFILMLVAAVLVFYSVVAIVAWIRFRGTRIVTCPATGRPAAVALDAGHAATTAVRERADLRVQRCSGWPGRTGCDEACVSQIAAAPGETRALAMAVQYFQGKRCAICQMPIDPPKTGTLRPGFMHRATHQVIAWDEVPPENLPEAFTSRRPICAGCTRAETFRRRINSYLRDRKPGPRQPRA